MPRNEFMNHDDDGDFDLEVIRDAGGNPIDIIKVPRNHPGKGEDEGQIVEDVAPDTQPSLADLRKTTGATTTERHIAELYGHSDQPLS